MTISGLLHFGGGQSWADTHW